MRLRLDYSNRYSLWNDLSRGNVDRLFVESDSLPVLATELPIEVSIADLGLRMVVSGMVVALRRESKRFDQGVYVHFSDGELTKCQRFLGMRPLDARFARVRRARRVYVEAPVRFVDPKLDINSRTSNISTTGLCVSGVDQLLAGQRVCLQLTLDDQIRELEAGVAWATPARKAAGLQLIEAPHDAVAALLAAVKASIAATERKRQAPILVASENPELNESFAALTRRGYELFKARSADEALSLVRELQPRLVMIDILMPQMDAVGVGRAMRGDAELLGIPLIFVAELEETTLRQIAHDAGASDYMCRPLAPGDLLELTEHYLSLGF